MAPTAIRRNLPPATLYQHLRERDKQPKLALAEPPPPSARIGSGSPLHRRTADMNPPHFHPLMPCLRDRVAQTAAALVLAPIFEADLHPEPYAYRAARWTQSGTCIGR